MGPEQVKKRHPLNIIEDLNGIIYITFCDVFSWY